MPKILTLIMLIAGVALVVYGISASQSLASSFSKFFTGSPTEKSIWMLIAGGILIAIGLAGFLRSPRDSA